MSCANGEWKVDRWVEGWIKPRKGPRRRGSGNGNGDEGEMQVKGRRIEQLWMLRRTLRVEARKPRDRGRERGNEVKSFCSAFRGITHPRAARPITPAGTIYGVIRAPMAEI
jgi:hypothetical protein